MVSTVTMVKDRLFFVLFGLQIILVLGAINPSEDCRKQLTCGDCIRLSPECSWCEDLDYFGQRTPKCNELKKHLENKCKKISNPLSENDAKSDTTLNDKVKVFPQNVTLQLRPEQPTSFKVKVRMPDNFPIDLYYLMDLSGSMLKDIQRVKTLGKNLAAELSDITKQFRLGFGAFVDKPLAPYIDTHPIMLKQPDANNPKSVPAFGFRNMLPLSKDPTDFENTVAALNISGNVDNPEGGLDALVQVAVCDQDIRWKNKVDARRLVIFTTDSGYHFAGDGLLGGVVTPYDNKCHLSGGHYTASTHLDFPSVGHVRQILLQNQVAPIFAITKAQIKIYENLANFLGNETGAVARRLNANSSNIVPLVKEAYLRIAQTQTITDDAPDGIKIKYTAKCTDGTVREGENTCTGVKIGEEVSFDVSVTATDCSKKQPGFSLKTAFGDVHVKLEYICDCECESLENTELNSPACNSNGSLSCGLCTCNKNTGGRLCGCSKETVYDNRLCESGNGSLVCSGRGECVCGECVCSESKNPGEVIYGKQCECTNMDCKRDPVSDLVCGGPEHGKCDCGTCYCVGNWTGEDCMCTKDKSSCIDENGVLCSGRGSCECGKCVCNETSGYSGAFCSECKACSCEANRDCVQCWVFGGGKLNPSQCKDQCGDIEYVAVDEIDRGMGAPCQFTDQDDCVFYFAYKQNKDRKLVISYKRKKECPEEVGALVVILAVVLGVLGVGLALLLIWKLLATIQDRREFAKFEKERQNAKWDTGENPIFKQATTTFQNPTYGGK